MPAKVKKSVLQTAMAQWRSLIGYLGVDLSDDGPHLIDFRFANDLLLLAKNDAEAVERIDDLMFFWGQSVWHSIRPKLKS